MSSLQSIMNLDDDQPDASSPMVKKDKEAATPASGLRGQDPSSSTTSSNVIRPDLHPSPAVTAPSLRLPTLEPTHLYYTSQQTTDKDPASGSEVSQGKRPAEPTSATPRISIETDLRRQSSTSVDSMEQHGYGSAASSSSMGGGPGAGGYAPGHPRRPMGSPSPDIPIKLTPITGRVSRAKKGVPVHVCDQCNPPKTFTRAEHLRRHQLSHQVPRFPCNRCERVFHRQDLLTRHQQRHDQEGDRGSHSEDASRRGSKDSSTSTIEQRMTEVSVGGLQPPYPSSSSVFAGSRTPSSMSMSAPATPPTGTGSGPRSTMSPPPGDGVNQFGQSPSHPNYHYTASGMSINSSPEPPAFSDPDYMAPRTTHVPLFVATQGLSPSAPLSMDNPPELIHNDCSPWTSASESTYSEISSTRRRGLQQQVHHTSLDWQASILPAYATDIRREMAGSGGLASMTATPYYASTNFPVSPHLAPVPHPNYDHLIGNSIIGGFPDEQSLLDPAITGQQHALHQPSASVRSQTPPSSISTSGQTADTLVMPAPLPYRMNPLAQTRQKEIIIDEGSADVAMAFGTENGSPQWNSDQQGGSGFPTGAGLTGLNACGIGATASLALPRSARNAIPSYLDVYWERFHAMCPIVHRRSFESEDVLVCAMAAVGTQYLNGKEDRIRGSQLHEYAWQEAKRYPQLNLQVMQAIFLCEYFARFRGRKAVLRPSKHFVDLYSRVLDRNPNLYDTALSSSTTGFGSQIPTEFHERQQRWRTWLDTEGRRRLLAACFILDNHIAAYFQQARVKDDVDPTSIPLTGPSDPLWAAGSAEDWAAMLDSNPAMGQPQFLPHLENIGPDDVLRSTVFDQASVLYAATLTLPRRAPRSNTDRMDGDDLRTPTNASYAAQQLKDNKAEQRLTHLFTQFHADGLPSATVNSILALHHTPLHDLLAVSGDSWVLSQKILGASNFQEHQKRLKAWIEGRSGSSPTSPLVSLEEMSSSKATVHAARTLTVFLDRMAGTWDSAASMCDFWALYVCTLIIWAFGQKSGKASFSPTTPKHTPMDEEEAVSWLRSISQLESPEMVSRVRGRREASAAVVAMVKRHLEVDSSCIGGRSRLYVDAVGVLRKLEERVNYRWF